MFGKKVEDMSVKECEEFKATFISEDGRLLQPMSQWQHEKLVKVCSKLKNYATRRKPGL